MNKFVSGQRIEFSNGWAIDIHEIKNEEVYCQRWPPGVQRQSIFANLFRMPTDQFETAAIGGVYA